MATPLLTQRWRERRDTYRPAGEVIRPADYEVAAITESAAKTFVLRHHYSATYPAARFRYGLYRHGALAGVAVCSQPASNKVLTNVFPGDFHAAVELGRFVLLDEVPGNGESYFLARVFEQLRAERIEGVVSFSDPVARTRLDGSRVFPGHIGTIYQATNGVYLGRATPRTLRILPDGTSLNDRTLQKIRAGGHGLVYSTAKLVEHGATPAPADKAARLAWLAEWLPRLTRPLRHPGNHKYAWALHKGRRGQLAPAAPYPKWAQAA
jgi:hypothetical protein